MKEGAWVHHSYGYYAPSTYGSYEPRRANASTAHQLPPMEALLARQLAEFARRGWAEIPGALTGAEVWNQGC